MKGSNLTLNGCEDLTLRSILDTLERSVGKDVGSTGKKKSLLGLGFSDHIEEFFIGIAHDKNMARMADFFEENSNINLKENDFFGKFNLQNTLKFSDFYKGKRIQEEELVFPLFSNYKAVTLD